MREIRLCDVKVWFILYFSYSIYYIALVILVLLIFQVLIILEIASKLVMYLKHKNFR